MTEVHAAQGTPPFSAACTGRTGMATSTNRNKLANVTAAKPNDER